MKNSAISFTKVTGHPSLIAVMVSVVVSGCASAPQNGVAPQPVFSQSALPDNVKVPQGHKVMLETVGIGEISYECKAKAPASTSPNSVSAFEWVFVGPQAKLNLRSGKTIGKYFGPPATWESLDGSKVTGAQVAIAPASAGNIPLQLVKANPAQGSGQMVGVSFIQRVATRGGVAPALVCDASRLGSKSIVSYQSDYIFWTQI